MTNPPSDAHRKDLPFACRCGAVSGMLLAVGPDQGDHVICHCTDCQDLAYYLGHAEHILDDHGGTPLYQSRCARLRLDSGRDRLACLHLTDKPMLRWYAGCCRMPLFNSHANGRLPFFTVQLAACDPATRDAIVGPPRGHLYLHEGIGDTSGLPRMRIATLMRRFFVRVVKDLIAGDRRRCALFDPETLEPIARPHRLTPEERLVATRR